SALDEARVLPSEETVTQLTLSSWPLKAGGPSAAAWRAPSRSRHASSGGARGIRPIREPSLSGNSASRGGGGGLRAVRRGRAPSTLRRRDQEGYRRTRTDPPTDAAHSELPNRKVASRTERPTCGLLSPNK